MKRMLQKMITFRREQIMDEILEEEQLTGVFRSALFPWLSLLSMECWMSLVSSLSLLLVTTCLVEDYFLEIGTFLASPTGFSYTES